MAQWLTAVAALPEDQGLISSNHTMAHSGSSSFRVFDMFSDLCVQGHT